VTRGGPRGYEGAEAQVGGRKKEPLSITARWVPRPEAAQAWNEAIEILAEGLAELAIQDARREVELELEEEREAERGGKPLGAVDRAMRAPWFPRFVEERDRYSYRQHEARLGVPRWILREALLRKGLTKVRQAREPDGDLGARPSPAGGVPAAREADSRLGRSYDIVAVRDGVANRFSVGLHPDDDTPDGEAKARALIEEKGWKVIHVVQRG
jgi:hypothetical protein